MHLVLAALRPQLPEVAEAQPLLKEGHDASLVFEASCLVEQGVLKDSELHALLFTNVVRNVNSWRRRRTW
jgi:hypothetical protein